MVSHDISAAMWASQSSAPLIRNCFCSQWNTNTASNKCQPLRSLFSPDRRVRHGSLGPKEEWPPWDYYSRVHTHHTFGWPQGTLQTFSKVARWCRCRGNFALFWQQLFSVGGRVSQYRFLPSCIPLIKCLPDVNQNQIRQRHLRGC